MTSINDINNISLPDIYIKNSLDKHVTYNVILKSIVDKLNEIPELHKLRVNVDLIKLVVNIIENLVEKGNKNEINKKELCVEIFCRLFPNFSITEIEILKNIIEFLWQNNHIRKIGLWKQLKRFTYKSSLSFFSTQKI